MDHISNEQRAQNPFGRAEPSLAADPAATAALGIYGKFPAKTEKSAASASRRQAFSSALRSRLDAEGDVDSLAVLADSDRFAADSSDICMRYALQAQARCWTPTPRHSITRCHRWLIPPKVAARVNDFVDRKKQELEAAGKASGHLQHLSGKVEIRQHLETGGTHLRGLETCKSVWSCTVCSMRLMEQRTIDLQNIVSAHVKDGGTMIHVTLTVPHVRSDSVKHLVKSMAAAYNKMGEGRSFKHFRKFMTVGDVRAFEVTYGEAAGFHPHFHVLYFLQPGHKVIDTKPGFSLGPGEVCLSDIERDFFAWWSSAAVRCGFAKPSESHGVKVRVGESQEQLLAAYISKFGREPSKPLWGVEAEVVKLHAKMGSDQRFHPFDFLRAGMLRDRSLPWKKLWLDYCDGFKGQQQLRGMTKLGKKLGVIVSSDDQILESEGEVTSVALAHLDREEWSMILACGARGLLVDQAKKSGFDGVMRVLDLCRSVHRDVTLAEDRRLNKDFLASKKS